MISGWGRTGCDLGLALFFLPCFAGSAFTESRFHLRLTSHGDGYYLCDFSLSLRSLNGIALLGVSELFDFEASGRDGYETARPPTSSTPPRR